MLLFGKNPKHYFPRARIRFVRYEGTEAKVGAEMNVIKDVVFEGRVLQVIEKALEFVRSQIKERTYLGADTRFVTEPEYRVEAFMLYATIRNTKTDANLGDTPQVTPQVKIIAFCSEPRSKAEIANHCGFKDIKHFTARYLKPLLESGQLRMTAPDKPNSSKQKYITVQPSQ